MASKKSPAQIAAQAEECWKLSLGNFSTREIAEKLGISQTLVVRRLALYRDTQEKPKLEEYRNRQLARIEVGVSALWERYCQGDDKATASMVRLLEREGKLMGYDAATAFVVKNETQFEMDPLLKQALDAAGRQTEADRKEDAERAAAGLPALPRATFLRRRAKELEELEKMDSAFQERTGIEPPRRQRAERKAIAAPLPDEFAKDNTFQPHEVHREAVEFADDVEEFEPVKAEPTAFRPRRGRAPQNPASRFLVDSDD